MFLLTLIVFKKKLLVLELVHAPSAFGLWTQRANKKEVFAHKEGHYRTKQTFIV
jgi:hypothetical protein